MRTLSLLALAVFSSLTFAAAPNGACIVTVTSAAGVEAKVGILPVTISSAGNGTHKVAQYKNYTFNFIYKDSGALGPYDSVSLQWTDGVTTSQVMQPLQQGAPVKWCIPPVMLFTEINTGTEKIAFSCGSNPVAPTPAQMQKPRAEALAECFGI